MNLVFEWLPVNEAGEVDAKALLDLNQWYWKQEDQLKQEMTEKAKNIFERIGE